jgi:radical SAM superfamily enzyme YgiQ (UPF0313 family)
MNEINGTGKQPGKVLFVLLPFWTPQLPPLGIACIKSYLKQYGFEVKTADANIDVELREAYYNYYHILEGFTPEHKRGNYSSLVNDVWQNHMMAHLNYEDEGEYIEVVKLLTYQTFFWDITGNQVKQLNQALDKFYCRLEAYLLDLLAREKPAILGFSAFIGTFPASVFACRLAKRIYPDITTLLGGGVFYDQLGIGTPNLEFFLEKTKDCIDKIFIGEGENLVLNYLQGKIPESQRVITRESIGVDGVDLRSVEIPDISDFQVDYYPYIGIYAARSCPFQCNFCSDPVFWGKYRKKPARQVVDEMIKLHRMYNSQLFIFADLLLNPIINDIARELLERDVSLYWDSHLRVGEEVCDLENTILWRRAGFYRTELGVESGSQRLLDLMEKRITVDQTKRAVSALAQAGIKVTTYWVIGYPGETEADFRMTLDLVEELKDDIYEAMSNAFWYYPQAPVKATEWKSKEISLFPTHARDLLLLQKWVLDTEPHREEMYQRVNRFVNHCKKLGIPDIYSLKDIHTADMRWKKLHKNAVPPMVEFKDRKTLITENKNIKPLHRVNHLLKNNGEWGF